MLLGLHGRAQAGKDTAYERLAAAYPGRVERLAFADKLYESAAASIGESPALLRALKTDPEVELALIRFTGTRDDWEIYESITVRRYLQLFGTEGHRDVFGSDFWVKQVAPNHEGRIVCITDVRFPNEADHVHSLGGHVVQVFGPPSVEAPTDGHSSESPFDPDLVDFRIQNTNRHDGYRQLDTQLRRIVDYLASEGVA